MNNNNKKKPAKTGIQYTASEKFLGVDTIGLQRLQDPRPTMFREANGECDYIGQTVTDGNLVKTEVLEPA